MHERPKVFLWRIGSNALPTNLCINQRTRVGDPICPLCGKENESYSYIFLKCQVIKPIWFGLSWGLYLERIPAVNSYELLNFVINPPLSQGQPVVHKDASINHLVIVKNLEGHILEHFKILEPDSGVVACPIKQVNWSALPLNLVKFNVDAALSEDEATLAVVTR
jgi:hypothetical protein